MSKQLMLGFCLVLAGCGPKPDFRPFDGYASGETAIYGYVTDLYSCPLADAQVTVPNSDLAAVTNSQGQYGIRLGTMAAYDLNVERSGFEVSTANVEVGPVPLRQDFPLVPTCPGGQCPAYRPPCQAGTGQVATPPN